MNLTQIIGLLVTTVSLLSNAKSLPAAQQVSVLAMAQQAIQIAEQYEASQTPVLASPQPENNSIVSGNINTPSTVAPSGASSSPIVTEPANTMGYKGIYTAIPVSSSSEVLVGPSSSVIFYTAPPAPVQPSGGGTMNGTFYGPPSVNPDAGVSIPMPSTSTASSTQ